MILSTPIKIVRHYQSIDIFSFFFLFPFSLCERNLIFTSDKRPITMADVEAGSNPPEEAKQIDNVTVVEDLSGYGSTIEEKVDSFIVTEEEFDFLDNACVEIGKVPLLILWST